jgi:hypothetical protein
MPGIAETDAYARLRADWGCAYTFSYDGTGGPQAYRADRREGGGEPLYAADPDALRAAVLEDYMARRMQREAAS